jgi:hypothetical protein
MRIAVSLAIFVLAWFALASAQTTTSTGSVAVVQKVSLSPGESTVTGCLKGSTDQYYLVQKDGTMRLLMGPNDELRQYVGHWVELAGNRDNRRDASASSDEGTPHGLRFFQVENILADQGSCNH